MKLHHVLGPAALAAIMVVGCTPSALAPVSSSPAVVSATPSTPTKTPSPSPTLDRHQAAAVAALEGYDRATDEIEAAPSTFTKAAMETRISEWAGDNVVQANVSSYLDLAKKGLRYEGQTEVTWRRVGRVKDLKDERGLEVRIAQCRDQRQLRVVTAKGSESKAHEPAPFVEHDFVLRLRKSANGWKLYGWDVRGGDCR